MSGFDQMLLATNVDADSEHSKQLQGFLYAAA